MMYAGDRISKWPEKVVIKNVWAPEMKEEKED